MQANATDAWYVSYEMPQSDNLKRPHVRATQTFRSEAEAKAFAKTIIERAVRVAAGTINPHRSKRTISSLAIEKWIGDYT